jgi:hypothetical protein
MLRRRLNGVILGDQAALVLSIAILPLSFMICFALQHPSLPTPPSSFANLFFVHLFFSAAQQLGSETPKSLNISNESAVLPH